MRGLPRWALNSTITVIKAAVTDTGLSEKQDWTSPVTVSSVRGSLQPAGARVQSQLALNGVTVTHQAFLQPVSVTPGANRLLVNGAQYIVRTVSDWGSHVEALVEVAR